MPVTVKMRLGWDEATLNAPLLARRAEQSGVKMVTIHGRTRCQFYQGRADWRAIARIKQAVSIPVVANGDVGTPADAAAILEQFRRRRRDDRPRPLRRAVDGRRHRASRGRQRCRRRRAELADYVVAHYEDMLSLYGVESGLRQARKHLGWYLDRHAPSCAAETRKRDPDRNRTGHRDRRAAAGVRRRSSCADQSRQAA